MKLPLLRSLPALILALAGLAFPACSTAQEQKTNYPEVAHAVVQLLQESHYSMQDFEDALSRKTLQNYLDTLDFSRMYFTRPEVEFFRTKYATEIDDQIALYKLTAAKEIFTLYMQKLSARFEKIKALIEGGKLDFSTKESVEISRKEKEWPATEADLDELWRKEIIREVLQERISAKHAAERRAEREGRPDSAGPAPKAQRKTPDTPEQKVVKRHKRYLDTMKETEEEEISDFLLSAVATAYDPHSEYMSAAEEDRFGIEMKKYLFGIGAVLQSKDGAAEIKQLVAGGPADKSGELKIGDLIVGVAQGVDGEMEDVEGMKLQKIVERIRGAQDTTVRLKVQPADDPSLTREIIIVRAKVEMKDTLAKGEVIEIANTQSTGDPPVKVGWINLDSFYADMERRDGRSATRDVRAVLIRMEKEGIKGVVLDLRGNGGGSLEEAINMTGLFVKSRTPVVQQRDNRDRREPRFTKAPPVYNGPVIVLTDHTSASASEICAAALQDTGRALVVGDESSFGKGTVQTLLEVADHMPALSDKDRAGSLKVTIAKFYRITGETTQKDGVTPDIKLPSRYDALEVGERFLKDPLPFDRINPVPFEMSSLKVPKTELLARSEARTRASKDFEYIRDYITRMRELVKKNVLSLNESVRLAEDKVNSDRLKAQKEERKKRVAQAAKNGDPYRVWIADLDSIAAGGPLKLDSEVKKEEKQNRPLSADDDDEDAASESEEIYPHGFDPVKLEAMHILKDYIELAGKPAPNTARADSEKDTPKPN